MHQRRSTGQVQFWLDWSIFLKPASFCVTNCFPRSSPPGATKLMLVFTGVKPNWHHSVPSSRLESLSHESASSFFIQNLAGAKGPLRFRPLRTRQCMLICCECHCIGILCAICKSFVILVCGCTYACTKHDCTGNHGVYGFVGCVAAYWGD
jgi:hypothetical protein